MINWGVIGTGLIIDMFCTDFKDVEGANLHSVYGRQSDKAVMVAEKFGFDHNFSDLDEFLKQPECRI